MKQARKSYAWVAAAALVGVIALAACGDDSGSTAATTAASSGTTAASAGTTAATAPTDTTAAGPDRTGQTIKVGVVNQDSGPVPFPDFLAGAQVAIQNINDTGGINGAKLEVVLCSTSLSPESSINCANKMIEANVVVAYTGADFTAEAALPVYTEAGLPWMTTVGWGPSLETSKDVFIMGSANAATAVGAFALLQQLKLTKVALAYDAVPAAQNFALNTVPAIAKSMGIEVQPIPVDPAAPDFAAIVATAQSGGAQAFWGIQAEPGCTAMVNAALSANFAGPIIAGSCTDFINAIGDKTVGVYSTLAQLPPDTGGGTSDVIKKHLVDYEALMAAAGQEKNSTSNSIAAFGAWEELASVLKGMDGDITAESLSAALAADADIPGWFAPDLNCGAHPWPDFPSYCSAQMSVWQVAKKPDGTLGRDLVIDFFDAYERSTQGG